MKNVSKNKILKSFQKSSYNLQKLLECRIFNWIFHLIAPLRIDNVVTCWSKIFNFLQRLFIQN